MAFLLPLIFIAFALMLTKKRGFSDDEIYSSFAEEAWESTPKVSLALTVYSITGKREAVIEQDAVRSQATNETGGRKSNAHHDDRVSSGYSVYSSYNSHISYASTE
ncbi:hypothetical protein EGW08_007793 [Elysia chlorotica]|uniref:Uncharacterized protein n=1 Tax=Elysia chlorotica TaxID=188477 RepID=A0A3S1BBH6_ELYCH|nr:hypothetical protein EGW08_007793 [Elysia chlorotica]